jgi:hypothetical protein
MASCRGAAPPAEDVRVEWRVTPEPAITGPATLRLTLLDPSGLPIRAARLRLEGHMTHPGMAPVVADVRERSAGEYEAVMHFSMQGDWVLLIDGELADGRRVRREHTVRVVGSGR